MTRTVLASAAAVLWCVAASFAQQQPAPATEATPAHNVYVLTGCLKAGDAPSTFTLADASSIGQAIPPRTAEPGAVGTSGQKASYELRPVSGLDAQGLKEDALKAHVGRRVEVIVRPIEPPAAKPIEPAPQRFSVSELKHVTGNCS
jgi:hypothetical protein